MDRRQYKTMDCPMMVEIAVAIEDDYVKAQRELRSHWIVTNRDYVYGTKWARDEHGLLIGDTWTERLNDVEYVAYVFQTFIPTQL